MGEYRDIFAFVGVLFVCCGSLYLFHRAWRFFLWVNNTLVSTQRSVERVEDRYWSIDRRVTNLERL